MFTKQLYVAFTILLGGIFAAQSLQADSSYGQIVSFDDEEVEIRVNGEIDYWPANRLGQPPIAILAKDSSNFVKIDTADNGMVWVSLSYVTTNQQAALKKNCQSQQIASNENKKQFGIRGIGESCE
ncbi:MAG: hypothetical protein QNL05_10815 [Gammaproteobacteria bacterium]|nr:hypothetical protein [Gammaproteobacteria bacterium]